MSELQYKVCLNYLEKISQTWWSTVGIVFYNELPWLVSELPDKKHWSIGSILQ